MNRWLSFLILVFLLTGFTPSICSAETVKSGYCGEGWGNNVSWSLDEDGTLSISGSGKMVDSNGTSQWSTYNVTSVIIYPGVTSIGDYAFSGCTDLTSVEIPSSVTRIGKYAFSGCYSLASIEIPEGVTIIGKYAFFNCRNLTSIEIPEGVTCLEEYVFHYCTGLEDIKIPSTVKSIKNNAFDYCGSLMNIDLPPGIISIANEAFFRCNAKRYSAIGTETAKTLSKAGYSFSEHDSYLNFQYIFRR